MRFRAAALNAWRRAPAPLRRLAGPAMARLQAAYARAGLRPRSGVEGAQGPIRIVGYFSGSSGIAASARLAARAFEALGVAVERVDVTGARLGWPGRLAGSTPAAAWIFHLNPPEMLAAMAHLGPSRIVGPRYGFWAWELPRAPDSWLTGASAVDEVWAPSQYTARALAGAAAPVRVVPHPLFAEDYAGVEPLPRGPAFKAVSLFDFNSSLARKNPLGAVRAFAEAFGDDPGCELVLKTQNGAAAPDLMAALRAEAGPNVRIIDGAWSYAEVKRLIAGADVLVSLHRAEGFGLTPAEAMALGVPVLATAFSGNLDFMDESCALMVPFQPTPVADPQGIYAGQTWAEPNLAAAADGLRRLRAEPDLRRRLGGAGRDRIHRQLSPQAWFESLPRPLQEAARRSTGA